jgi:hypothetical protein
MTPNSFAIVITLLLAIPVAHGATWSFVSGSGKYSKQNGVVHETFDDKSTDPKEALNLDWNGVGGGVLADTIPKRAYKPSTVGNFFAVTGWAAKHGVVTFRLDSPADYYGFFWGTVDYFNTVTLYDGQTVLLSLNGTDVANGGVGTAWGSKAGYFGVVAGEGESITKVVMTSTKKSFESDNHAVRFLPSLNTSSRVAAESQISAVPEPSTYAMFAVGLGVLGAMVARRRRAQ